MIKKAGWKLYISFLITFALAVLAAGCGGNNQQKGQQAPDGKGESSQKQYVMRIGTVTVDPHQHNATMAEFKKRVEPKAGSRLKVELYPASQLGTLQQQIQGLQNGSIQAVVLPSGFFSSVAPALNVIDLPYFLGNEQLYKILNSGGDKQLSDYLQTKGMIPLGWLLSTDRIIITKKPINKMDDFKGLKLRTFPNPIAQKEVSAFGAAPTILDTADVYVGLQQGTIDGIVTDVTFIYAMKLNQEAKYLLNAPKGALTNVFMASKTWMDSLPADLRETIAATVKDVVLNYEGEYLRSYGTKATEEMKKAGLQIIEPSPELEANLKEASKAVHELYFKNTPEGKAIYDGLKAAAAKS